MIYAKQVERDRQEAKKRKMADDIVGEGTTTIGQSRTEHVSEDLDKQETTFTRPPSDLQT